jgi:hypothetical protein
MLDRVAIVGTVRVEDIDTIVLMNYLEECSEGDEVYYRSTQYSNLSGLWIEIRGTTMKAKFSVNKQFCKARKGRLDNSTPITMAMAARTIREILMRLCLRVEDAKVTYYEIGLTMRMEKTPDTYIRMAEEAAGQRTMWNDPNYPEFRQKVTEKSKYHRKILKMYDKTYEATEKGRDVAEHVLRIETVYKRQSVMMSDVLDPIWQAHVARVFYEDWSHVRFARSIKAGKGVKLSQWDRAREIYEIGQKKYLAKYRDEFLRGGITKKQWETMRTFAKNWDHERQHFEEVISDEEAEYQEKLTKFYQVGKFVSKC